MERRGLSLALLASATGATLLSSRAQALTVTPPRFAQTPAESTAGVTPTNLQYVPGHVDRYGTNTTPGTTSMDTAFQAAINQARVGGADVVWGDTGLYALTGVNTLVGGSLTNPKPLDCTFATNKAQHGINFRQITTPAVNLPPNTRAGILVSHGLYTVFDLTGCEHFTFYDLSLVTNNGGTYPETCFLTARNSTGESNLPRFYNTIVAGFFSNAVLYNYASEDGLYVGNYWANYATDSDSKVVRLTAHNISALTSTFTTIYSGSITTTDHQFFGGQFAHFGGQPTSDVFELETCTGLKVYGAWMSCNSQSAPGRSYFYVNMTHGPSSRIRLHDIVGEDTTHYSSYGICIGGEGSGSCADWTIADCYLPNTISPIFANSGTTIYAWNIAGVSQQATHALTCSNMSYSSVNFGAGLAVTISGTSLQNYLVGDCSHLSVTTRSNDTWFDTGSALKTFTPAPGTITHGGVMSFGQVTGQLTGNEYSFSFVAWDSVSIGGRLGETIAGLPFSALCDSAQVVMSNQSTKQFIGGGYINAGTNAIALGQTVSAGPNVGITISGRYFVAGGHSHAPKTV